LELEMRTSETGFRPLPVVGIAAARIRAVLAGRTIDAVVIGASAGGIRPSIDSLMLSAAAAYGPALLGIVLTGANRDGAAGLASIGAAGGMTVVQEPDEAEQATMPREAIALRSPDLILSLADIHALLLMLPSQH
jgi:chemotaxis response regulator CheB